MEKKKIFHQKIVPFYGALILCSLAAILNLISYCSFSWIEKKPSMPNSFVRIGVWAACFDQYYFPEDYVSKLYDGCWFIYYPEFKYLWTWLTPYWFIMFQISATITLILNFATVIMLLLKYIVISETKKKFFDAALFFFELFAGFCYIYNVAMIAVMKKEREWLPWFDHNRLGWGYILHCLAGVFTGYAFLLLLTRYILLHCKEGFFIKQTSDTDEKQPEVLPFLNERNMHTYEQAYPASKVSASAVQLKTRTINTLRTNGSQASLGRDYHMSAV